MCVCLGSDWIYTRGDEREQRHVDVFLTPFNGRVVVFLRINNAFFGI